MQRMAMCIGREAEKICDDKRLHAAVLPRSPARISASQIRIDAIDLTEPENLPFGWWEEYGQTVPADSVAQG